MDDVKKRSWREHPTPNATVETVGPEITVKYAVMYLPREDINPIKINKNNRVFLQ